jgi:hypothetical protein
MYPGGRGMLVGEVVVVGVVVEFDIGGPDSLDAVKASAAAPAMIKADEQPATKNL